MRMRGADTAEVSLKSETDSNGPIELGFFRLSSVIRDTTKLMRRVFNQLFKSKAKG